MESLRAVNRYLRITWASGGLAWESGGFAWAPAGFDLGCTKTRLGGYLGAARLWRPLRISTGLTQAFKTKAGLTGLPTRGPAHSPDWPLGITGYNVSVPNKLQVIHLVLLTLVHHLCTAFFFHHLGPALPSPHSRFMNRRSAKHTPIVVESRILRKESIASPNVARAGSRDLTTAMTILHALTRLQQITATILPTENCTLHISDLGVLSLLHQLISTSPPVEKCIRHGTPFATLETRSLGLHL
ncbi:hypothetical protein HOY80DRAFT_1067793 [Tuber brumale]|nr:hypothetical protein HOY80DRAFT_1067793 [Tuber brumale]